VTEPQKNPLIEKVNLLFEQRKISLVIVTLIVLDLAVLMVSDRFSTDVSRGWTGNEGRDQLRRNHRLGVWREPAGHTPGASPLTARPWTHRGTGQRGS
jgi:hypothetical protein